MTAEENIASLALFVRPRIHEIMNRWWILESLKSIRNQRHDLSFLLNIFNVQKSWLKVVTFFKNDDVYETVETESISSSPCCPPHTPAVQSPVLEKVSGWKLSETQRRRPGGLVTFTFSQPADSAPELSGPGAISLSKYLRLKPPENTRISTSAN